VSAGRPEQGHILLEVIISVFLLTAAFTSLARLTLAASWMVRQGRWRTAATSLACQKMEELLTVAFSQQAAGEFNDPDNPLGEDGEHDPAGWLHRSWTVGEVRPGLCLVVVEVGWTRPRPGRVEVASHRGWEREVPQP
jgi:hypothetical protein